MKDQKLNIIWPKSIKILKSTSFEPYNNKKRLDNLMLDLARFNRIGETREINEQIERIEFAILELKRLKTSRTK